MKYIEIVEFWLRELLENENSYKITSDKNDKVISIHIEVEKSQMGKIIGKNGRIITSLRNLISSIAKKNKEIIKITVKDI